MKTIAIAAAALLGLLAAGCSPQRVTDNGTADSIPRVVYVSASSYICTVTSDWGGTSTREAVLDARYRCKFKFFDNIDAYSDSVYGTAYLHDGRVFTTHPSTPAETADSADASLKCVGQWTILNSGEPSSLFSLTRADTLNSVDSAVAYFIWWHNGGRQVVRTKSP